MPISDYYNERVVEMDNGVKVYWLRHYFMPIANTLIFNGTDKEIMTDKNSLVRIIFSKVEDVERVLGVLTELRDKMSNGS